MNSTICQLSYALCGSLLVGAMLFSSGCGQSTSRDASPEFEEYQFEGKNRKNESCSTGRRLFANRNPDELRKEICDALQDTELNKDCAQAEREQMFREVCQGQTFKPTEIPEDAVEDLPQPTPTPAAESTPAPTPEPTPAATPEPSPQPEPTPTGTPLPGRVF